MGRFVFRVLAALRRGGESWLIPAWVPAVFVACALVLVPWIAMLYLTLPQRYVANHWRIAWAGFDVGLIVALVSTAILVSRRSVYAEVAAAMTATLLVCDAWFDVLTSHGATDIASAAITAVLVELPLAALCFWMATNLAHAIAVARPYLLAAGFTTRENRLVPPPE